MSGWARNLVIKVRNEISRGCHNVIGTRWGGSTGTSNFHLDQYYRDILNDKEKRIANEEEYRRLMGSMHEQEKVGGGKFALNQKNRHGIYTGPLTYEEIEAIEDITKETK